MTYIAAAYGPLPMTINFTTPGKAPLYEMTILCILLPLAKLYFAPMIINFSIPGKALLYLPMTISFTTSEILGTQRLPKSQKGARQATTSIFKFKRHVIKIQTQSSNPA